MGKTECMQCFLSSGLPSSAYEQVKWSPRSVLCMPDEGAQHDSVYLHEESRAVITSISTSSMAKKNIVQLQPRLPPMIHPCWQTTSLKCFLTCALTTTASSSSVKPECQLPLQGKTCCSICGAEAKHLGRKPTQVCFKTQQSCCAWRPNRQILM